jgi:anthranilate phosphoribosyltransferase
MELLKKLAAGKDLTASEASNAMEGMMNASFTPAQAAALLVALKIKGESVVEIAEFAKVMRKSAVAIRPKADGLVDTCGTGGDGFRTFNVSTCAAIIAAACGANVAKHGNRSVSSSCGSADVLEALGVNMMQPAQAEKCIDETGFCFMFAPYFHPAMKNVAAVRKELGIRTVFNILGPLTNPAGAKRQVLGVFDFAIAEKMANVLNVLGCEHALVVNSDGMDEIGLGNTDVCELKNGKIEKYEMDANAFGFEKRAVPTVKTKEEGAKIVLEVLEGKTGAARDVSVLNAAADLYVAGKAKGIETGIGMASEAIDSGKAKAKLAEIVRFSGAC